MFASRTVKTIPIPFDPPHEATIQKLAGRHLGKAREENQYASVDQLRRMGGPAFQKELEGLGDPKKREEMLAKHNADPLNSFDLYVICQKGIKAWTCVDADGQPIPVTDDTIEDLDEDAIEFFAREILKLTKPSLFQTKAEQEVEQKNA